MRYSLRKEDAPLYDADKAIFKNVCYANQIVGNWFVLGFVEYRRYENVGTTKGSKGHPIWLVRCLNCEYYATVVSYTIMRGNNRCLECTKADLIGPQASHWKGGEYVPMSMFSSIKDRIVRAGRNIPITVTISDLDELWVAQDGVCAYTGLPLTFSQSGIRGTASVDRIDSQKGYEPGNVQFVHKDVNTMKWDFPEGRFLEICALVAQHTKDKGDFSF